ncbi:MAG TPA: DUF4124 domain-containing protein [Candidatus Binatia bacterium]|nr:DUF4124 domain-containing protein [Candidatus Binatia bacterium]
MKMLTPVVVLGWFLFLPGAPVLAQGGIYKWTDAKGRVHFSNAPTGRAESVDEALPPASTFATQLEPASPAPTATEPAAEAAAPPVTAEETPPFVPTPAVPEPTPADEPGMSADQPSIAPDSSAAATTPGPDEAGAE